MRTQFRRGTLRLRGVERDSVIRIRFPSTPCGIERTYAYVCRGARVGDMVEVHGLISGHVIVPVIGLGRNGYAGSLKRARLVR